MIAYNDKPHIMCAEALPSESILEAFQNIKAEGGTDFGPPLQMAFQIMQQKVNDYDQFVVCLMTDGESQQPAQEIQAIKRAPDVMGKLKFTAIGYGEGKFTETVLKPIA